MKELRRGAQSTTTSRSTNVAMSNILMNIPASAAGPSIFQPSNILCSSTPMKQSKRQFTNRNTSAELHLDPSETPIRGPGAKRKTSSAALRKETRSQNVTQRSNNSESEKPQVVRHFASNSNNKQNVSSNSESDQTESDSCNMTGPQKPVNLPNQLANKNMENKSAISKNTTARKNMYVSKSSNLGGRAAASNTSRNIPVIKSSDTDNDFPTTDFNNEEEMNDLNRTDGKNNVAASVPVFPSANSRQEMKSRNELGRQQTTVSSGAQSRLSSVSASVPVLRKKTYTENHTDSQNGCEMGQSECSRGEQLHIDGSVRSQAHSRNRNEAHSSDAKFASAASNSRISAVIVSKTKDLDVEAKTDDQRPRLKIPSTLTDSFNEDLLFDTPSMDQHVWTPRTPSENSGTQPRIPQDPSLQPEIPAVLPAKSTELTTFSQSPRWHLHLNKNQSNYPVPAQQAQGFRPEPIRAKPKERAENKSVSVVSRPNIQESSRRFSDSSQSAAGKQSQGIGNPREAQFDHISTGLKEGSKRDLSNKTNLVSKNSQPLSQRGQEPISANWYFSPADHETHVAESTARKRNEANTDKKHSMLKSELDNLKYDIDVHEVAAEEYLPIQRNTDRNRSAHSDSGIMSAMSDSECKHGQFTSKADGKLIGNSVGYKNTNYAKPGYFSDSSTGVKSSALDGFSSKHRVVHSPVLTRQSSNTSPLIRDYISLSPIDGQITNLPKSFDRNENSVSPVNGRSANGALKTEKLQVGAVFSPIHPQPVTNSTVSKSVAVSKDILHPTPMSKLSASVDAPPDRRAVSAQASDSCGSDILNLK